MKNERLLSLRNQMKEAGVHCMVIPTSDYHNSEYVSDFFMARKYFSGFTGSAGTAKKTFSAGDVHAAECTENAQTQPAAAE
mgnify:CR=1 FL=1